MCSMGIRKKVADTSAEAFWASAMNPALCRSMTDIRREIDRVDRALVGLMAERQAYIERAAELKSDRHAVRDEARIEDVIAKVLAEAEKAGLKAEIAEPVWRTLVERSIAYEFERFDAKA
jgi:isochorismate pyruvate lyase